MWTDIKETYRGSADFVRALPLLALVPVVAEMVQHVAEVQIGMFDSFAGAEAAGASSTRMGFGYLKVLTLFLIVYPVTRFLVFGGDRAAALTVTRVSAKLFGAVLLLQGALLILTTVGTELASRAPISSAAAAAIGVAMVVAGMVLELYLAVWKTAAALGNPELTIAASFRLMRGRLLWSLGFALAMMIPLMIVHQALNLLAIGTSPAIMWLLLIVDSVVAGLLGIVLAASVYKIARRATDRAGIDLLDGADYGAAAAPAR